MEWTEVEGTGVVVTEVVVTEVVVIEVVETEVEGTEVVGTGKGPKCPQLLGKGRAQRDGYVNQSNVDHASR